MLWFRMYADAIHDEKLGLLAFEDRWHFTALLCCKSLGVLDADDPPAMLRRKVAFKLGLDVKTLDDVARRLAEVGLIEQETLQPVAWDRRQYQSDNSASRTKAYRERVKRHSDVTVTPPETDTETDTDTEKDRESTTREKGRRATRLPPYFPDAEALLWAERERADLIARDVAAKFRDYWCAVPGAKGRKLDWAATWRNFVRTERVPRKDLALPAAAAKDAYIARLFPQQDTHGEVIDAPIRRVG